MKSPFAPKKSRKEIYEEEYQATKKGGEAFFPETIARDAVVAVLVVGIIIALSIIVPARLEPPADPTSTTYNPRPEWYFLFFFQFLKLFPGSLEAVVAVIIPVIALALLLLVPFLDRTRERRWSKHWPVTSIGLAAVLGLVALEIFGTLSAPAVPAGEESLVVQKGRAVYQTINCGYCHSINGVGGNIGPDLSGVGGELDGQQLEAYLQNPHAMVPETLHPKLLFTEEELNALTEYLGTLGARVSFTEAAPGLYDQYCAACHALGGSGGTLGPDLSTVGARRSLGFLEAFTSDPSSVMAGTTMPAFKGRLTPEQIRDIAAYLANQK
jgi:mono/diheme cytochrome c family protein